MAKKSMIARWVRNNKLVTKYYETREQLKKQAKAGDEEALEKLQKLPVNSSPTRLNKRCQQCGRPHAVYRKFGLCRICLRLQLMLGNVPGGRKSSW